ncbi:MAG: Lysozyme [candidate division TM6 bacterium GW2011_GWE2_41_16]|nr:MAG: Lysozyme [candidate division TM6 bacterium GW2011_GWE2_41_16]
MKRIWMIICAVFFCSGYASALDTNEDEKPTIPYRKLMFCLRHPCVWSFLDTIAYSEGTYCEEGYNMCFTKALFSSYVDHPRVKYTSGKWTSSAAGRYQFLARTWDRISKKLNLKDFSPQNQDRGAIQLVYEGDALEPLLKNDFAETVRRTASVWASFPNAPYGQPTRKMEDLFNFYRGRLVYYKKLFNQTTHA